MASLLEVFDRDILLSYLDLTPERSTAFWDSGVFNTDSRISQLLGSGSSEFVVPYITGIDSDLEANYSNTVYTDIAEPRTIEGGRMKGMMAQLNEGFAESKLARHLGSVNALELIAGEINTYWRRQAELRALATLAGLRNADATNNAYTVDATSGAFDYDAFVEAEGAMADQYEGKGAIVMNKAVYNAIRTADAAALQTAPSQMGNVTTYNGRRVILSKDGTEVTNAYATYLLNDSAFVAESQAGQDDLEVGNSLQRGNGGGYKTLWTRRDLLIHPTGFSFTGEILTGGTENEALFANWSDLQQADNWDLVADADKIPFRVLLTAKA